MVFTQDGATAHTKRRVKSAIQFNFPGGQIILSTFLISGLEGHQM